MAVRLSQSLLVGAAGFSLGLWLQAYLEARRKDAVSASACAGHGYGITPSPRALLHQLSPEEIAALPYPPDILPGGRTVETPYGNIQVYEWGPETGERVLLIHGISTPVLALGNLGKALVAKGFHVMMFDLFGRGWSDSPDDVAYDTRLYVTQILLVLASSPLPWTGNRGFHLFGYSLGGGIAASFARFFPHLIRSLTLITPCGFIRRSHVDWKGRLLYSRGLVPEWLLATLVRRRLYPPPPPSSSLPATPSLQTQNPTQAQYNSDASGGDSFDHAVLSQHRPSVTVATVIAWQLAHHAGFVSAFMATLRNSPIYEQYGMWTALGRHLAARRVPLEDGEDDSTHAAAPRHQGTVLFVLGATDTVIIKDELLSDAHGILGDDGMEVVVLNGGHEIAITQGCEIANAFARFVAY